MSVRRFDVVELAEPKRLPNGLLRVDGRIARPGLQIYYNADGSPRRELRPRSTVFDAKSMASFELAPLTNTHPPVMIDASNAKRYVVGACGAARNDGDKWIAASLMFYDDEAIAAIDGGRRELSAGYDCTVMDTPGTDPEFGTYDAIQVGVCINHIAVVNDARAGHGASLRLDSAGNAVLASESSTPSPAQERPMKIVRIDGLNFNADENGADGIQQAHDRAIAGERTKAEQATAAEKQRADAAEKARADVLALVKTLETERDTLRADRDAHKKRADEGEQAMVKCAKDGCNAGKMTDGSECPDCMGKGEKPKMDAAGKVRAWVDNAIAKGVTSRAALMDAARPHLPAEWKADGKSDLDVKRVVVANLDGRDMAAEPAAYVERRYSIAIEEAAKREDGKPRPIDGARPPIPPVSPPNGKRRDGAAKQAEVWANASKMPAAK